MGHAPCRRCLFWEWEFIPPRQGERRGSFLGGSVGRGVVVLSLFFMGLEAPVCQEMFPQLVRKLCTCFRQNPSRMALPCVESLCQAGLTYLFKTSSDSQSLLAFPSNCLG